MSEEAQMDVTLSHCEKSRFYRDNVAIRPRKLEFPYKRESRVHNPLFQLKLESSGGDEETWGTFEESVANAVRAAGWVKIIPGGERVEK